jgi:hypothetical protein
LPILLSKTFETVSEESAANGDACDRGFHWQDEPHSFKEVVDLIQNRGFVYPSDSTGTPRWLSSEAEQNMRTGDWNTDSIHPGKDARSQRYWQKACRAAGIIQ